MKDVDKNIAFILELVGGLFGFLGIGYMFAGDIAGGVVRLVIWFAFIFTAWIIIVILTAILIGICFIPLMIILQVGVPIMSAFLLKKKLEELFPE